MKSIIILARNLSYNVVKVNKYEYHISLDGKLVFRVWDSKKEKWYSQKDDLYNKGYKELAYELGNYYLNNN